MNPCDGFVRHARAQRTADLRALLTGMLSVHGSRGTRAGLGPTSSGFWRNMTKSECVHESDGRVLEGLEAVRQRPSLFIGAGDRSGVVQLLWEVVDNAVDLYLARCLTQLSIEIRDGWFEVEDDG